MKIDNHFVVALPIEEAWDLLTDIEGIAPCLPGAQLTGSEGDVFEGRIKVKVGPVTSEYQGTAKFVEKDDAAYRAVIDAKGRDSRGAGNASAMITAEMHQDGDRTAVNISTDLKISGKVAQFGRGIITDVSEKLLGQFVDCLEIKLAAGQASQTSGTGEKAQEKRRVDQAKGSDAEVLDLMQYAGSAVSKRLVPLVIGLVLIAGAIFYLFS